MKTNPVVVTISMSLIGSSLLTSKLYSIQDEALGFLRFADIDLQSLRTQFDRSASLVIMNLPSWSTDHAETLMSLRAMGYRGPIVALVNDPDAWRKSITHLVPARDLRQLTVLAKSHEDFELTGLVRRLIAQQSSNYRTFARYDLVRLASLHAIQTDATVDCHVTNVSKGGACIEMNDKMITLTQGSYVQLHIATDNNEEQRVDGRVVWTSQQGKLVGVEFLSAHQSG